VVWMDFIYISLLNGRRAKHPDNLMELFHQAKLSGVFSEDGFNQRVVELRADQTTFRAEQSAQRAEQNVQRAEQSAHRAEQSTQRAEPRELAQA